MLDDESRLYWDEVPSEKAKGLTVRKINQCTSICVKMYVRINKHTKMHTSKPKQNPSLHG